MRDLNTMRRTPLIAPFCLRQTDFTGGLKSFAGQGRINSFSFERVSAEWYSSIPVFGSLRNSGSRWRMPLAGGICTGSVIAGLLTAAEGLLFIRPCHRTRADNFHPHSWKGQLWGELLISL